MQAWKGQHRAGRILSTALLLAAVAACGGGGEEATTDTGAGAAATQTAAAGPASGEQLYQRCATCHMPDGKGMPGTYPPLAGSEFATSANVAVPIRVVMHGMQGPVTVAGAEYNSIMPAYGTGVEMSDEEVAAVLTYVRSQWGNNASPVTAEQVATERAATRTATGPVTAEELKPLMQ